MKTIAAIAALSLLASCGGHDSSKNQGAKLDPITVDKYEQAIRALKPGMTKTKTSTGTTIDFKVSAQGKWSGVLVADNSTEKETILNIIGDDMYTLVETTDNTGTDREVKKESIEGLIRAAAKPMPAGFSMKMNGSIMTITAKMKMDFDLDVGVKMKTSSSMNFTVNTDDIRCSDRQTTSTASSIVQDGSSTGLPNTSSVSVSACGTTLSSGDLKAIDLKSIRLCDETKETDEETSNCTGDQDLSYLVQ